VRGYLTVSAWRDYEAGPPCRDRLPNGLRNNARIAEPIITRPPRKMLASTTSRPEAEIVSSGLVEPGLWAM
jgi:phosphoribosylaminoimidazole-succinocarboxamide synthase